MVFTLPEKLKTLLLNLIKFLISKKKFPLFYSLTVIQMNLIWLEDFVLLSNNLINHQNKINFLNYNNYGEISFQNIF